MFAGDALPGIRVDVAPAPVAEALPRMDVAVFAGFAERGPCHRAIALSSPTAYETVFGGVCPLAYEADSGARLTGNLAATVRAFFSNGGKRCWAIRLAETDDFAAVRASLGVVDPGSRPATMGHFALPGILCRLPDAEDNASIVSPAMLGAASLGSWSDAMQLATRVARQPLAITRQHRVAYGLRFADRGVLSPGDLIELGGGNGLVTRYAKVLRISGGEVFALWIASFARITDSEAGSLVIKKGHARISGESGLFIAKLTEGTTATLAIDPAVAKLLVPGRWVQFLHQGEADWLRIETVKGSKALGPAWQQVASRLPGAPLSAARVTVDIAEHRPGTDRVSAGLSPAPEAAGAIQGLLDADLFHADPANRTAAIRPGFAVARSESALIALGYAGSGGVGSFGDIAARFGTPAFTPSDRIALRSSWLPIGLDASFGEPIGPVPQSDDPLVRDGLSRFDERLFLDPRLADLRGATLVEQVAAIRDLDERQLFGIHAAFDIAGDLFPEPSLLAVPDAVQPGWETGAPPAAALPPQPGAPANPDWRTHSGGCASADTTALAAPDFGAFLDSSTRLLDTPMLVAPTQPVVADLFTLSWGPQPAGSVVVLEEAAKPDFSDAVEILRDTGVEHLDIPGRAQGAHYYRLHIELDGNVSSYASAVVVLHKASYVAFGEPAGPARLALLARLQVAMVRIAGANGDFFALLSLPRHFRTADAAAHASALTTLAPGAGGVAQLGADEQRLLSFGAVYHPWLMSRGSNGLLASPPEGAVAGMMAARAEDRGAWIAPANDPLQDIVGLDPAFPEAELLTLDRARVNMVRRLPLGFTLYDADTLSSERDWRQINVRRLMMLLRRTLLRRGMTYVFEPNGPVLRRAVERSLVATLDDLQQRGAFAGASSAQSFRVAVQESAADLDGGRLVVEISVAPAQPIRFLTVSLVQQGARLTILEAA
ncbi:hypothetical protein GCM10009087_47600 [Sphingomonas oligophenolica]|uniref:Phage tail sheath C-terminal domain-containing protein n=1 Tax=Sphingomonas oligophenolica TaxID=301154 RepID=A0ABU9Y774_9SPHN